MPDQLADDGSLIQSIIKVSLTPAQILALTNASTVQILPPPGPGKYYQVTSVDINIQFPSAGGVAYAGANALVLGQLVAGVIVGSTILIAGQLNSSQSFAGISYPNLSGNLINFLNQALVIGVSTAGSPTAGNSVIVLTIRYRTISDVQ